MPNRRRKNRQLVIAVIGLILALAAGGAVAIQPGAVQHIASLQPGLYPVTHVSDGDTITVKIEGKDASIRMLGVDTPEVHDPRKPVQCFGQIASDHTKARLNGSKVRLEPDPTNTDRDKYGRLLRYVYLPDGTLYNAELIRDGYAFAYTVFPLVRLDEFRTLEREAREGSRGLWAGCAIDEHDKIKQTTSTK